MSDAVFLGQKAASMELDDALAVSRVNIDVDSDNYYTAGTDAGAIVNVSCPWGSEAMAQSVLTAMSTYTYRPYTATDALLDPAAELGDAITVGGIYSIIASLDIDYNRASVAEIAAPGLDEIDDEYPYITQERKETNKVLAQARSIIRKTAEEILLSVESQIDDLSASVDIQLDGITATVQGLGGAVSAIKQKVDNITLSVSNESTSSTISLSVGGVQVSSQNISMSGFVTYTGLSGGSTTIDGACIKTGKINANRIDADNLYVNAANITGELTAARLRGSTIYVQRNLGTTVGYISTSSADSGGSAIDINSYGAGRFVASGNLHFSGNNTVLELVSNYIGCGRTLRPASTSCDLGTSGWLWGDIYATNGTINTSDRNRKTDISYDMSRYEAMFDALKPANFKMIDGTSGRTHTGFISQDIEDALAPCGLTSIDFATFIKSPKVDEDGKVIEGEYVYGLRYDELIALMVTQIQSLKKRVADLEVAHG